MEKLLKEGKAKNHKILITLKKRPKIFKLIKSFSVSIPEYLTLKMI